MKTSHQLARELLAGPDMPIWHFDPSRAGLSDETDSGLSVPEIFYESPDEPDDPKFITVCGETDQDGEAMSDSESELRVAAQNVLDHAVALEGGKNRVVPQALLKELYQCLEGGRNE